MDRNKKEVALTEKDGDVEGRKVFTRRNCLTIRAATAGKVERAFAMFNEEGRRKIKGGDSVLNTKANEKGK